MRVRLTRYKGKKITLSDGTVINRNDMLLKIHLHNVKLLRQMVGYSEIRRALIIYRGIQESLPPIARYLQMHDYANEIKGLIGITTLHKGCMKLGFEACPIHNPYYKLLKQVAFSPIYFLSLNNALNKKNRLLCTYLCRKIVYFINTKMFDPPIHKLQVKIPPHSLYNKVEEGTR